MFMFSLSMLAATAQKDPDYFAREPQFRHYMAHEIQRMNENIRFYQSQGKGHQEINYMFNQLRQSNDPSWARMRNYTRDLLGPKWARQNLGI